MKSHVAIYARVSSDSQDFAAQMPDLESRAQAFRDAGREVRIYTDKFTGREMTRPGWDELWNNACAGKVDTVIVWRLDRLGRTAVGLSILFEQLRAQSIRLISLRDGIDGLDSPTARLIVGVLANVAVFETEVRSERQRAGIAIAKTTGAYTGGKIGRRVNVTAEKEAAVRTLLKAGTSYGKIHAATGLSKSTVCLLKRRFDAEESQLVKSA